MKLSAKQLGALAATLVLLMLTIGGLSPQQSQRVLSYLTSTQPGLYQVLEVSDGDTITVDMSGQPEQVRFIGVDTPELHHPDKPVQCFAKEAREFLASRIAGQPVRLQADPLDDNRDLYGRLLRYVYLSDGTLLNTELVRSGHGFAYTHFPFTRKLEVIALQAQSQTKGIGLWSACKVLHTKYGLETNSL